MLLCPVIQILGLVIALLAFTLVLIARKKKRLNSRFLLFWVLFWSVFIVFDLYPSIAASFSPGFTLELSAYVWVAGSALTVFVLVFALFSFLFDLNQKVTTLIREQAVLNGKLQMARAGGNRNNKKKRVAIIIPAHDEENSISSVLERIPPLDQLEKKIFVIDDGSEDSTAKIAEQNGVEVIRHPVTLGVGGALKTGYLLAKEWDADVIAQFDADGEHDPMELPNLLEPVLKGEVDMVLGSRFMNGDVPLSTIRKMGIRFYTWLVNKLTRYKLTDITIGYRVFKRDILDKVMFPSEKHWAIAMALLASRNGVKIKEVPIRSTIRKTGKSQFHEIMTFIFYHVSAIKQIIDVYL